MKKILLILFGLILVPTVALAAFNDVTVTDSADILLPGNGLTYTLTNSTRVESFEVSDANIQFTMQDNSIVELQSTDRSKFTPSAGCEVLASTCTATLSSITMQCRTSITLTITPGAAATCTGGSSGSSPGGSGGSFGGGGGSAETPAPAGKTDTTVVLNLSAPFTLPLTLSSSPHTVVVNSASTEKVEFTISSEPLKVVLNKGETKALDTDGDGVNDLQVTYSGLDASSGKPKIRFVELAATTGAKAPACALSVGEAFKRAGSSAVWYITKDCKKRAFNNSRVFFTYFNGWSDVSLVGKSTLDSLADDDLGFMPWGPKYDPKYGALVKVVTDPKVYLLLGTEKYWITSEEVFGALGYYWNWIEDIDEALLAKYTTGSEINYTDRHPDFTLVKYADDNKVYKLEGGKKRHVKNEAAFEKLGYRWDRIVTIGNSEVYEDGVELNGEQEQPASGSSGY